MVYIVVLIVPAREDKSARGRARVGWGGVGGGSRRVRVEDNFTVRRLTGSPFLVARFGGLASSCRSTAIACLHRSPRNREISIGFPPRRRRPQLELEFERTRASKLAAFVRLA